MSIEDKKLKNILEAALMAMAKPMTMEQLMKLFDDEERPSASRVKEQLKVLAEECEDRGIELKEVASGYRYQARQDYAEWLGRLWEEKPAKYSRAYLETLALIAYRQPVTRAEIEEVRGVSVSSNIIKTMMEREWIRVVGHRDVPGRPSLYATTRQFLDYFNMKSLDELPSLAEIKDLEDLNPELELNEPGQPGAESSEIDASDTEAQTDQASEQDSESLSQADVADESNEEALQNSEADRHVSQHVEDLTDDFDADDYESAYETEPDSDYNNVVDDGGHEEPPLVEDDTVAETENRPSESHKLEKVESPSSEQKRSSEDESTRH